MQKKNFKAGQFTLKPKQQEKLINSAGNFRDRCLIKLMLYCGLRRSEACQLQTANIDWNREQILVTGKGDKQRIVPVPGELLQDLKFLIGKSNTVFVFPGRKEGSHLRKVMVNRIVAKAGEKAGLNHPIPGRKTINPHCLRHSFARTCKDNGLDLEIIQALLGHKSFSTTMNEYGLLTIEEIHQRVKESWG